MEAMKTHTFLDKRALDQKSMDVTSPDYCLNNDCKLYSCNSTILIGNK